MQLTKHDFKFKSFLKMEKRLSVVQQLIYKLPLIELKVPYQSGWYVRYEFKPEISRRKDIEIFKEVLRIGYEPYKLIMSPDDVRRIRRGEQFRVIKKGKSKIDFRPKRKKISEKDYNLLSPQIKKYFELDEFSDMYRIYKRKYYQSILSLNWLVLKLKPRVITHTRRKGGILEKEEQFLRDKLSTYWREYFSYRRTYPKEKERVDTRDKIQKFIKGETNDVVLNKYKIGYDD